MLTRSVILAAGQGTRMKSDLPKVLHPLLGQPLIWHAMQAARLATQAQPVVVIGYGGDQVRQALGEAVSYAWQAEQLGTGHAVMQAESLLKGQADCILVTYGDMPLLTTETLRGLVEAQQQHNGPFTMLTVTAQDVRGFGRIVRGPDGQMRAIVEEAHATPEQRQIQEVNPGVYCFNGSWLWEALRRIPLSPKGEYYLTDLVSLAVADGGVIQTIHSQDLVETIGINTRVHLAEAEAEMRARVNRQWMLAGVTLVNPAATYIEVGVSIGQDTILWPNTYLRGATQIGRGCEIGPNTLVRDSQVGDHCKILASVLEGALLEDEVDMGPFARLRKGAHLGRGVHMGNFGEVKNAYLAAETKMGHFSYIGDAEIGARTNIGAGTITCNYDGERKHRTEIGEDVFLGSDTMLVAPVRLGDRARSGAGAVVTHDVPADTLVVGVPARPLRKLEKRD